MLNALFYILKIGLVLAAALWIAARPGMVTTEWLGYTITAPIGVFFIAAFLFFLVLTVLLRMLFLVIAVPGHLRRRQSRKALDKGMKALTYSLSSAAAGQPDIAYKQAVRAADYLPEGYSLPLIMQAHALRMKGDLTQSDNHFRALLKNKETAFLGTSGLLRNACIEGDLNAAISYAEEALQNHPRNPELLKMAYDLRLRAHNWNRAMDILGQRERYGGLTSAKAQSERVALHIIQAEDDENKGNRDAALKHLKLAHKINPSFVPAAERLAALYLAMDKPKKAQAIIEDTWKANPHPDLLDVWSRLAPDAREAHSAERLKWYEKLVQLNDSSAISHIALGNVALQEKLWGEARASFAKAEKIRPTARLYKLMADLEDRTGNKERARYWLEKAADAPPDRIWICSETGTVYDRWSPVAKPHGTFNTIIWDTPRDALAGQSLLPGGSYLYASGGGTGVLLPSL